MELASKTNIFSNTYTAQFSTTRKIIYLDLESALTHCRERDTGVHVCMCGEKSVNESLIMVGVQYDEFQIARLYIIQE